MRKMYIAIGLITLAILLIGCAKKDINNIFQVNEVVTNKESEIAGEKELTLIALNVENSPFKANNQLFEFLNNKNFEIEKYKKDCDATQEYYAYSLEVYDKWENEINELSSIAKLPNESNIIFQDYMDECKKLNSYIYSTNCMYAGSMYIPISCDQLKMKCELLYGELVSIYPESISEYSDDVIDDVEWINYDDTFFVFEYSNDFEKLLNDYKLDEKSIFELRNMIITECELLDNVNNEFDFSNYGKSCLLIDDELIKLENENKFDESIIESNEKKRLKIFITELISLQYLIEY